MREAERRLNGPRHALLGAAIRKAEGGQRSRESRRMDGGTPC